MLSDEEKEALRNFKSEYETCNHNSSDLIIELDDAKIISNLIEKQQKEIDKQNKVIDEMAYCIDNYQICEYEIQDSRNRKCEYISDDENPPCKDCIKEYFIRKVEEDGKNSNRKETNTND